MPNRVADKIVRIKQQVAERLAENIITQEKIDANAKGLDLSLLEYVRFQELKSHAVAMGTLTPDEGQTIYRYLGQIPETFNAQPFEVKYVLTQVFGELVGRQITRATTPA